LQTVICDPTTWKGAIAYHRTFFRHFCFEDSLKTIQKLFWACFKIFETLSNCHFAFEQKKFEMSCKLFQKLPFEMLCLNTFIRNLSPLFTWKVASTQLYIKIMFNIQEIGNRMTRITYHCLLFPGVVAFLVNCPSNIRPQIIHSFRGVFLDDAP